MEKKLMILCMSCLAVLFVFMSDGLSLFLTGKISAGIMTDSTYFPELEESVDTIGIRALGDAYVSTYTEFKSALDNANTLNIYLDDDIKIEATFTFKGNKNVYGNGHIIDMNGKRIGGVSAGANTKIENIKLINQDIYSFFWSEYADVTVSYKNVISEGKQFVWLPNGTVNLSGEVTATATHEEGIDAGRLNLKSDSNVKIDTTSNLEGIKIRQGLNQEAGSILNVNSKNASLHQISTNAVVNVAGEMNLVSSTRMPYYHVGNGELNIASTGKFKAIGNDPVEEAIYLYNGSLTLKPGGTLVVSSKGKQSTIATGKIMNFEKGSNFMVTNTIGPAFGSYSNLTNVSLSSDRGIGTWAVGSVSSANPSKSYSALNASFTLHGYLANQLQSNMVSNNSDFQSNFKSGSVGKITGGTFAQADIKQTTIDELTTDSTQATGTAEPNADLSIKVGTTEIGNGRVGSDGKYDISINKQVAGVTVKAIATLNSVGSEASTVVKSVDPPPGVVTGIVVNPEIITLDIGKTQKLSETVLPENAINKKVTWGSSDSSVATVTSSGLVQGKKAGQATITATTEDGGHKATSEITVLEAPVTGVNVTPSSATIDIGKTQSLNEMVLPSNATNKKVSWKTSDSSVATVSTSGVVTGKKVGTAIITVTTDEGGHQATSEITVVNSMVSVTDVELIPENATIETEETLQLSETVLPSNASNKKVTWSSSDSSVATVSTSGLVTGKDVGQATITVNTEDGNKQATCEVTIKNVPVTGVELNFYSFRMLGGEGFGDIELPIEATVLPENATNKNVSWSTSDPSVIRVREDGKLVSGNLGKAIITVTTDDGNKQAICEITVVGLGDKPVTEVKMTPKTASIPIEGTIQLQETIFPLDASNQKVTWETSNPLYASVSDTGLVTAGLVPGIVTIKVITEDGGFSASATINVVEEGILSFGDSLDVLNFKNVIFSDEEVIVKREQEEAIVTALDTRWIKEPYSIQVSLEEPLSSLSGLILPDALFFASTLEKSKVLSKEPIEVLYHQPILSQSWDSEQVQIEWGEEEGILLKMTSKEMIPGHYSGLLSWYIVSGP